jgi:hypothetical protein
MTTMLTAGLYHAPRVAKTGKGVKKKTTSRNPPYPGEMVRY